MVRVAFWTALFLVVLRLAIGWHFFIEGVSKVKSEYVGETDTNKPFTSEGFFRNAAGPAGDTIRSFLSDPNEHTLELVRVQDMPAEAGAPRDYMPPKLEAAWDAYYEKFLEKYGLSDEQRVEADKRFGAAKDEVVRWLRGLPKDPDDPDTMSAITETSGVSGGTEFGRKVSDWIASYEFKLAQLEETRSSVPAAYGKERHSAEYLRLVADVAKLREGLLGAVDEQTNLMKDSLSGVFRMNLPKPSPKAETNEQVLSLVTLVGATDLGRNDPVDPGQVPKALEETWQQYADAFVAAYDLGSGDQKAVADELRKAKIAYVRWLLDRDEQTGTPLLPPEVEQQSDTARRAVLSALHLIGALAPVEPVAVAAPPATNARRVSEYRDVITSLATPPAETEVVLTQRADELRGYFKDGIERHTERFTGSLDELVDDAKLRVEVEEVEEDIYLDELDWMTRWGLTVIGGCLLIGFLTRFACTAGSLFLLATYLALPPFPWLPEPPAQEGTYFFVNKNMIEMFALAVLATLPTGRWLGIDGLLVYIGGGLFRKRNRPADSAPRRQTR